MKSTLLLGTRGSPIRWKKRAARPAQTTPRETRTRHARHGEATDLRDDPAWWRGGDSDAGKRPTTNDQTTDQSDHCTGTCIYTDEYDIYGRLEQWGYAHASVCHSRGEYARDEDGDGFHEVHVNTMEGFWSLLRSWLRPHRGISQDHLPLYLGFFEFVHNVRRRGKALLGALLRILLT